MDGYQHILLATDCSEMSNAAARRAAKLAQQYNATLTILHVVDYFPEDLPVEWIAPENVDPAGYLTDKAGAALTDLAKQLGVADARREVVMSSRAARHEIVRVAREWHADLIVVGSHGRRGVAALLGSTANGVLQSAPCDVLAVRTEV